MQKIKKKLDFPQNTPTFRRVAILPLIANDLLNDALIAAVDAHAVRAIAAGADALLIRPTVDFPTAALPLIFDAFKMSLSKIPLLFTPAQCGLLILSQCAPDGLHLKERFSRADFDLPSVYTPKYWGKSCHDEASVLAASAEGYDYLFVSPVFETQTHPEAEPLGLEKLAALCALTDMPIFALGGILTERQEKDCLAAGAYGIASIRLFQ